MASFGEKVAAGTLPSGVHVRGEWEAESPRAWNGIASDLAFVLDQGGTVRGVGCSRDDLWRELGGVKVWLGQPWATIAASKSQAAVARLLEEAADGRLFGRHLVILKGSNQRQVPLLCSATRSGMHVVIGGRDLSSLDLTNLLREHEADVACAHANVLLSRGVGVETLLLDILAPAARRLGDLWTQDVCTFVDVTTGLGHLQEVLTKISSGERMPMPRATVAKGGRILLASCPGEQHTFGLAMVAGMFRNADWQVREERSMSNATLAYAFRHEWFDVVGLSASGESQLDTLAKMIRLARRRSRNPAVRVLVGGSLIASRPELAAIVGADASAFDGRQAVRQAQYLLDEQSLVS